MPKTRAQKKPNSHPLPKQMEKLLAAQTAVILGALDEHLATHKIEVLTEIDKRLDERFAAQNIAILTAVDKRLAKLDERNIVNVSVLVDTGASCTCIDPSVLNQLGLTPTGSIQVNAPSTGAQLASANQYDVSLVRQVGGSETQ